MFLRISSIDPFKTLICKELRAINHERRHRVSSWLLATLWRYLTWWINATPIKCTLDFYTFSKELQNACGMEKFDHFRATPPFVHLSWCTWWTRTHLNTRRVRMGWKVSFRLLDKKDNLSRYRERWMHIILLFINFCITGIWSTLKKVYLSGKSFWRGGIQEIEKNI